MNGYRCDCGLGFKGSHCEIDVDLCNDPSLCSNSVSCTETSDRQSVQCTCKAGFTGYNCAVNINDCLSSPCKNGGTCRDRVSGFQCVCGDGFTGITCEGEILKTYLPKIQTFVSSAHVDKLQPLTLNVSVGKTKNTLKKSIQRS